ncbi:hypothetical protein BJY04DRAFT_224384 [Aspergillus karnatakaensis]|uniref:uncharacterized protein n=1 Tax=Aspergillus karnatakaensis TaxID=1810916 RepID=UPI003CCCD453
MALPTPPHTPPLLAQPTPILPTTEFNLPSTSPPAIPTIFTVSPSPEEANDLLILSPPLPPPSLPLSASASASTRTAATANRQLRVPTPFSAPFLKTLSLSPSLEPRDLLSDSEISTLDLGPAFDRSTTPSPELGLLQENAVAASRATLRLATPSPKPSSGLGLLQKNAIAASRATPNPESKSKLLPRGISRTPYNERERYDASMLELLPAFCRSGAPSPEPSGSVWRGIRNLSLSEPAAGPDLRVRRSSTDSIESLLSETEQDDTDLSSTEDEETAVKLRRDERDSLVKAARRGRTGQFAHARIRETRRKPWHR